MQTRAITQFFVRQPMLFWSAVVAILLAGILSFMQMPKLEDPAVAVKQASVVVVYPGATAHKVELQVAQTMEEQLRTLPDVKEIRTECREGMALLTVEFEMTVLNTQIEQHFDLLRRKVGDAAMRLPTQCYAPIVVDDMMDVYGIFYALVCDPGFTYPEMERYAKLIRRELLKVPGVKRINVVGARPEVINIRLRKDQLSRNGLLPTQIMLHLQQAGKTVDGGRYEQDDERVSLHVTGALADEHDIADLLIKTTEGHTVRLGDIATVKREYQEPQTNGFFVNGKPAIAICLTMQDGVVVPDVGKAVDQQLAKVIAERLPAGMTTEKIFFQPDKVSEAINGFMLNLLESVLIVIIVLMFTMGFRSGLIIGFGLVLTIAVTFPILLMMGSTLQRISLGAFIVAMGMLVDNAIVIMDGILIDKQRGMGPKTYLYRIGAQTGMPLLGATIIAISTFLAVYMSPDSAGEYCRDLFLVLCVSLLASWILALVQVPVCAKQWLTPRERQKKDEAYDTKIHRLVRRVITTLLGHKAATVCVAVALLVACDLGMTKVKNLFFPDFDYSQFIIEYELPSQASPDRVRHDLLAMSEGLLQLPKVDRVAATMGNAPAHYCLVRPMNSGGDNYGELMVDCKDFETVNAVIDQVRDSLRQQYPDAYIRFRHYNFSIATSHPVEVQFMGPDPAVLKGLERQAEDVMRQSRYVDHYSISSSWKPKGKSLVADYARQHALRAGIERGNVADALRAATDGLPVGVLYEGDRQTIVQMQIRDENGEKIRDLNDIPVWSMLNVNINPDLLSGLSTGATSVSQLQDEMFRSGPLSNVASEIALGWDEPYICRVNGERCIEAQCDPNTSLYQGTVAKVMGDIRAGIDAIPLPEGYSRVWAGEGKSSDMATTLLMKYLPVTVFIILTILLLLFRNWREVGVVVLCIPFVLCGITPSLLALRQPFTFMAIIGLMGLMGMMVKNAIVLVDEINRQYKEERRSAYDSVVIATVSRVRPVIMASATTILGMAPLLGDPMYGSMAICIMSGLAVGTLITLVLLPVLYAVFFKVRRPQAHSLPVLVCLLMLCTPVLGQQATPLPQEERLEERILSLQECRRQALAHNEQMQTADNAVRQAALDRQIAFANYLPQIDGQAMGVYAKDMDMMGMTLQMRGTYMAGITLMQPLYAGGQITAGNRLAAIGHEVSLEQRRQTKMQLIADVDKAYYSLIAVHAKVMMLEAYARQMQGLYDQVALSVQAQMATDADLLRITTKQSELSYQLQQARHGEELCRLSLAHTIGAPLHVAVIPADTVLSMVLPQGISDDIDHRPELYLLDKQVQVRQQQVKMARAHYLPTVALSLGYTYYDNVKMRGTTLGSDGTPYPISETFHGDFPMAMLTVQVPIFHWGADFKKVKRTKIDVDNARLQQQQGQRGMKMEARQAVYNLTDGYRMAETALLGQQQAEENLRVMRQRYDTQMATMTDLLEAQAQWQQARSNYIEALTQYKIYETDYLRVTGRLDE